MTHSDEDRKTAEAWAAEYWDDGDDVTPEMRKLMQACGAAGYLAGLAASHHDEAIKRVIEWQRTPNRKPAALAFTAGLERQIAYLIEMEKI